MPNDQDKLPGRLQQRHLSKSRDAGPVNFIGWFGAAPRPTKEKSGHCCPGYLDKKRA
jgi:hypothetical protein